MNTRQPDPAATIASDDHAHHDHAHHDHAHQDHDHAHAQDNDHGILSTRYKRVLVAVILINAIMFVVEMISGRLAGSQALKADALDFLGDTVTYGLSLIVLGSSLKVRASAAMFKGVGLLAMGLWVLGTTLHQFLFLGVPRAEIMSLVGFLALGANVASVVLLMAYKDGDANVRSVWLCSRNDAIGNVIVMLAALFVWLTGTAWPDLLVAALMASLFLTTSFQIIRLSWAELKTGRDLGALENHGHAH